MSIYRGIMSKIDSIERANGEGDPFAESFARLKAVESVAGLVANMAGSEEIASFELTDSALMESAYRNSFPMTQKRFDRGCDDLAAMAQTGAKALLALNSKGRSRTGTAAQRLMREIQMSGRQTLDLLRK
ncbi:hypothetical protein [Parasphingorhabdus cellanae]|uniref:Phasin domain-containing protein n=1 Tax=Parasphingorhabdus cellanae TaxID=2806553 RepID=A0ABX7T328_9SPHN|nr:hypothetical protein [Parasphingorhabdus cellanae]QTD55353.1 hypothetical protein J4G78_14210 [Parasphingorhabdus cellanae]